MAYASSSYDSVGIGIKVEAVGAEELARRYMDAGQSIEHWFQNAFWGIFVQLTTYPAPPPNSKYKRTFNLKQGWFPPNSDVQAYSMWFSNSVPYAPYVQGDLQANVHFGRWKTLRDVADAGSLSASLERTMAEYLETGNLPSDQSFFGKIGSAIGGFFGGLFGRK